MAVGCADVALTDLSARQVRRAGCLIAELPPRPGLPLVFGSELDLSRFRSGQVLMLGCPWPRARGSGGRWMGRLAQRR